MKGNPVWAMIAACMGLAACIVAAEPPRLVADLNASPGSGYPTTIVPLGSKVYFAATVTQLRSGRELWESDGTPEGTRLVFDPTPGCGNSSSPSDLTALGGKLYFTAGSAEYGTELWVHDPVSGQTSLVADINPGAISASPYSFTLVERLLFFMAYSGATGTEPYVLDSQTGTVTGFDLNPGPGGSSTLYFVRVGDRIVFTANLSGASRLCTLDPATMSVVIDPSAVSFFFDLGGPYARVIGDTLYYQASDSAHGSELWRVRPSSGEPAELLEVRPGTGSASPSSLTVCGRVLYFTANDGTNGTEVWRHSADWAVGTPPQLFDIRPGSSTSSPILLTGVGDSLFLTANNGTLGTELVRILPSDTSATIFDISPGSSTSAPSNLTTVGDTLFLTASDSAHGTELYRISPQDPGPVLVDISPGSFSSNPGHLAALGDRLYFTAAVSPTTDELYRIGRDDGAPTLFDVRPGASGSNPSQLTVVGPWLLFTASDGTHGTELFAVGNADAAPRLFDLNACPPSASSYPSFIAARAAFGRLYFYATSDCTEIHTRVWEFDPATGEITPVQLDVGCSTFTPSDLRVAGNRLLFNASCSGNGSEPWVYDPATRIATSLGDLNPGSASSSADRPVAAEGLIVFDAIDPVRGRELWGTDGTAAGTRFLLDANSATASSSPDSLTPFAGQVAMRAGGALYRTDGTQAGTLRVDPSTGSALSGIEHLTPAGGRLWFFDRAASPPPTSSLCVTDLNPAGTSRIAPLAPQGSEACRLLQPPLMASLPSGVLVFSGTDGSPPGTEPWCTDGTLQNTRALKDINTSTGSCRGSYPGGFTGVGGVVVFAATNAGNVRQLWMTDGTEPGTVVAATTLTNPGAFVVVNDRAYFMARPTASPSSFQVWMFDPATAQVSMLTDAAGGIWTDPINPPELVAVGTTLFFTVNAPPMGGQVGWCDTLTGVWGTTSQPAGPPTQSSLTPVGGMLVFAASWGSGGRELWLLDPASPGEARPITDIAPGGASSLPPTPPPFRIAAFGDRVYFQASDGVHDFELWSMHVGADGAGPPEFAGEIEPCGSGLPVEAAGLPPRTFAMVGHTLLLRAASSQSGTELWAWDRCPADFNGDGFVDFFDFADFVDCFESIGCPPDKTGDFNADGFVDFFDFGDFVDSFSAGC